jgi:hypothetical protein
MQMAVFVITNSAQIEAYMLFPNSKKEFFKIYFKSFTRCKRGAG